jgi:hypothetical protein
MRLQISFRGLLALVPALLCSCTGIVGADGGAGTGSAQGQSSLGGGASSSVDPGSPDSPGYLGDGGVPPVVLAPSSRLARLSHTQLLNTYRDLLGLTDVGFADSTLTPDAVVGFDNESDAL